MNGPGTVNMKVMRMDVDIMYEAKMDHDFVNVSVTARTNNLNWVCSSAGHMRVKHGTGYMG